MIKKYLSEPVRAWTYRVILAGQPLVVYYGLLQDEAAAMWAGLAGTVLGIGLAVKNTSTARSEESDEDDYPDESLF